MTDCKDLKSAEKYLVGHNYLEVQAHEANQTVGYKGKSGDETWESGVAAENDWFKQEPSKCCLKNAKLGSNFRYCSDCGTGINGTLSWSKGEHFGIGDLEEMFRLQEGC